MPGNLVGAVPSIPAKSGVQTFEDQACGRLTDGIDARAQWHLTRSGARASTCWYFYR